MWNGERLFQAAKFPTEMQYQHLVFEEFARKVQPCVNVFNDYDGQLDPAILAEFAHTVYRFGHSMLTETVDRYQPGLDPSPTAACDQEQIGLIEAFLNPVEFAASGVDAEEAAGAIARGMTRQLGNEIDEFVTEALRNNLVGLPLDLAAINIARGRETGVPTLNEARAEFYAGSGDTQVKPYESWADFAPNLKNPASIINFIAAYGTHRSIIVGDDGRGQARAATLLVLGGDGCAGDRLDFLNATGAYGSRPDTRRPQRRRLLDRRSRREEDGRSAACWARRSTSSSRSSSRPCRTATASTTCRGSPTSTSPLSSRTTSSPR